MKFLCLAIFSISLNATAANWVESGKDKESTTYFDVDSLNPELENDNLISIEFWTKKVFTKPKSIKAGNKIKYDSIIALYKIYCASRKYELISTAARLGSKQVFKEDDINDVGYITPDTIFEAYYNASCKATLTE